MVLPIMIWHFWQTCRVSFSQNFNLLNTIHNPKKWVRQKGKNNFLTISAYNQSNLSVLSTEPLRSHEVLLISFNYHTWKKQVFKIDNLSVSISDYPNCLWNGRYLPRNSVFNCLVPPCLYNWLASSSIPCRFLHFFDALCSLYTTLGELSGSTPPYIQTSANLGQEGSGHDSTVGLRSGMRRYGISFPTSSCLTRINQIFTVWLVL